MKRLNTNATSFIRVFKEHQKNMQQSVLSCKTMCDRIRELKRKLTFDTIFPVFIVLNVFHAVPENLQVFVFLIFSCAVFYFIASWIGEETTCVHTANSSIREFKRTVSLLSTELEYVKSTCETLRRHLRGSERANTMRLEVSVLEMFLLTDSLTDTVTVNFITQVYEEYEKTWVELKKMKVRLSFYKGTQRPVE